MGTVYAVVPLPVAIVNSYKLLHADCLGGSSKGCVPMRRLRRVVTGCPRSKLAGTQTLNMVTYNSAAAQAVMFILVASQES